MLVHDDKNGWIFRRNWGKGEVNLFGMGSIRRDGHNEEIFLKVSNKYGF